MNNDLMRTLRDLRAYPGLIGGALLALLISVITTVTIPQVMKAIIDDVIAATSHQQFALVGGLAILGLGLGRSLASFLQSYLLQRAGEGLGFQLRQQIFTKLERLGFSYHDNADTGQLITRLTSDVDNVKLIANTVGTIIQSVLVLLVTAGLLLVMNWRLALFTLIVLPPMAFMMWRFQKSTPPLFGMAQQRAGALVTVLQENIANTRIIRVFVREEYQLERFRTATQAAYEAMMKIMRTLSINIPIMQFFAQAATAIVIGIGGYDVINGDLSLGELVAFSGYVGVLVGPIFSLVGVIFSLARASASAQRIYELLDLPLDTVEKPGAPALPPVAGPITFENVSFRYPETTRDALQGVSFTIAPGQLVLVKGQTGSGKSTLALLLPRFHDVTGGQILIDGQDVRDVTLSSLRRQVGVVFQTPTLFNATIRDNIAYGRPTATLDEVQTAARLAQADKFIETLPLGYETELGEGGAGLSGGQKQRLTLARTLLMQPPILVLDDSMSALDAQTKQDFAQALRVLPWPCTRIVIGEPAGLQEDADLILVMDQGQLIAQGRAADIAVSTPPVVPQPNSSPALEVVSA